jgi:signal transduction histidine kinase
MSDPQLDEKNRQRIARIARAVAEMGEISGALLALAREQEGQRRLHPPCDVVAVTGELVERYRDLHHGKPVTLNMTVTEAPVVHADRTVLAMVLANLLRNALSYTESGEVQVTLEHHAIVVEDSGVGLGSGDSSELFQPYVRGEQSSGAGLGLSLVKRLCERQGWQITLANRPDGGTKAELAFSGDAASAASDSPA